MLEQERQVITKELVELHYFFMHQMLKENKIRRLNTYQDWFYSIMGNCINATIVDNCRILKQNIEAFSLKNKMLQKRAAALYEKALKIKEDIYKLPPKERGTVNNKDFAKMFAGKHRNVFEKRLKKMGGI